MLRRLAAVTVLVAVLVSPARADHATLRGQLRSADTAAPLAGACITVTGTSLVTYTDDRGQYLLTGLPHGVCRVAASLLGYAPVEQSVAVRSDSVAVLDLVLHVQPLPVSGMVVTARGRPSRLADLAGSAATVGPADLEQRIPVSLSAAVAAVPGVAMGTDMPWSSRVQIRGLDRDHVVMLVNGNRISTTNEVAAQFGTVVLADVEQIEVLKGPVSVLYGTGSTGGVVNVIPRRGHFALRPQVSAAFSGSYESVANGWSGYARAGWDGPRVYLLLSQSYRDYGSYTSAGHTVANSQFRDYQTHVDLGCRLAPDHVLELRYQSFQARNVGIPGGGSVYPVGASVRYPSTPRRLAEATWRWTRPGATWQASEVRLFTQAIDRRAELLPLPKDLPATATLPQRRVSVVQTPTADHDTRGLRWHNNVGLGAHRLALGLDAWEKQLSSRRTKLTTTQFLAADGTVTRATQTVVVDRSLPNSTFRPIGVYAEDEVALSPGWTWTGGARLDVINVNSHLTYLTYEPVTTKVLWPAEHDRDLSWCAQSRLTRTLRPGVQVYANLASSFRSPGLEERFLYVDLGNLVRIGDPRLNSERGRYAELGTSLTRGRWLAKAQLFRNRITDMVIEKPDTLDGRPALRKANAGTALLRGGEAQLDWAPARNLLLSGDVSYVRGRDTGKDQDLPGIAPLAGHASLQVGRAAAWWGRAGLELAGRQDHVAPGEAATAGHHALDLSMGHGGWRWAGHSQRLTLGVRNALDARYHDHLATSRGFDLTAPGRSLYAVWASEY